MRTYLLAPFVLSAALCCSTVSAGEHYSVWNDSLAGVLRECRDAGIPTVQLENKIHEGHAKKRSDKEIYFAVKTRRTLLLQIREHNKGVMPDTYAKSLFSLEERTASAENPEPKKVNVQTTTIPRHTPETIKHVQGPAPQGSNHDTAAVGSNDSGKELPESADKRDTKAMEKMQKAEAHSEKMAAKAAERAEKRMNAVQKRMQKRAMKKNGAE